MRDQARAILSLAVPFLPVLCLCADVEKGLAAYDIGDYETAITECQPLAEAGNALAQFCMGRLYANGFGVPMDDAQALHWYGAAAEQGHSEAQFNLGVFHANGWGVEMDDAAATHWYQLAAEQGFLQAQTTLAKNYEKGRGVAEDLSMAFEWYAIAAALGDTESAIRIKEIGAGLSAEQLAQAQQNADAWLSSHGHDDLHAGTRP